MEVKLAYFVTLLFVVILFISFYVIIKDTLANMPEEDTEVEEVETTDEQHTDSTDEQS